MPLCCTLCTVRFMQEPSPPTSFRDVLRLWPRISDAAQDLDLPYERVSQWAKRNSIPPEYWPDLIRAAAARGYKYVSLPILVELAASPKVPSEKGAA